MIEEADRGDGQAMADLGAMLYAQEKYAAAVEWLQAAAQANNADGMQWLATAYASGNGVPHSRELAVSWLAKAAAASHSIATAQLREMR